MRNEDYDDFSKILHMSDRGSINQKIFSISVNQRLLAIGPMDRRYPCYEVLENSKGYKMTLRNFSAVPKKLPKIWKIKEKEVMQQKTIEPGET